jgi:voltage-gated potassium channel
MYTRKRLFISLLIFVLVFLVGVAGFKVFGGKDWTILDSVYMTVITVATVGYEEVIDLNANPAARIFVIAYIIVCLGTIAFAVTSITAFIVEGELKNILGRKKMEKEIAKLKNHYIVCGSDETAQTAIQELLLTKRPFVVIEPSKEKIERLSSLGKILFVQADSSEDEALISAGIERAIGILLSLPTDEANLFVTLTARSLNPKLRIVAKGIDLSAHKKMMKAGADYVVSPTYIGGMRMVSQMTRPAVVTFLDMMLRDRERVLRVEEVMARKGSWLAGKTVAEFRARAGRDALLVAIKRANTNAYDFNPPDDDLIGDEDIAILIASPDQVQELEKLAETP